MPNVLIPCHCGDGATTSCTFPDVCGRGKNATNVHFANTSQFEANMQKAVGSVGVLTRPDGVVWGSAFVLRDNVIVTAGHNFGTAAEKRADVLQRAESFSLVMNLESGLPASSRKYFCLELPRPAVNDVATFAWRVDQQLDAAVVGIAESLNGKRVSDLFPNPPISARRPLPDDTLFVIHHQYYSRLKVISKAKCTRFVGGRIHLRFDELNQGVDGASGGLIVDTEGFALGVYTDGGSFPYGYSILAVLGALFDAETARSWLPKEAMPIDPLVAGPLQPNSPYSPAGRTPFNKVKRISKSTLPETVQARFGAVGKIFDPGIELQHARQATAFIVARGWILTAKHVVTSAEDARRFALDFHFDRANTVGAVSPRPSVECRLDPASGFFCSSDGFDSCDGARYHLDYALSRVKEVVRKSASKIPELTGAVPEGGREIFIVQHSGVGGEEHKGVLGFHGVPEEQRNQLLHSDDDLVYHDAARFGGTSGAPIFDHAGRIFAMHTHHASRQANSSKEPLKQQHNWGARLSAVARDLKSRHPNIGEQHAELAKFLALAETDMGDATP